MRRIFEQIEVQMAHRTFGEGGGGGAKGKQGEAGDGQSSPQKPSRC